jgi:uncharacterized protein (UPF0333 family)
VVFEQLSIAFFLVVTAILVILALYTWYYSFKRESKIRELGEE